MTITNLNSLDKRVQGPATRFIKRVNDELCIRLKVVSGLRSKADQDDLYEKGRTIPGINVRPGHPLGDPVTYAKGASSNHTSGLAIDVYVVKPDGTIDLDTAVPAEVVKIAREEGFEWGGDWKKHPDLPHFETKF